VKVRTAVILAAGSGFRLGERGRVMPKGFLELGPQPIVVESIERLNEAGIERIVIVTGHHRERYEALAEARTGIETVYNPRFAESGSMLSLTFARARVEESFLLLESDLIYEPRALTAVLDAQSPDLLLLSGATGAGDEVWVEVDAAGCLVNMSKDRSRLGPNVFGELVGITKVSRDLFAAMLDAGERLLAESPRVEYETDALVAAARRHPVPTLRIDDLVWAEIDDEAAFARARAQVYPRLGRPA
jgi:2-aminoethylphosphonate-pyruvate transaminase